MKIENMMSLLSVQLTGYDEVIQDPTCCTNGTHCENEESSLFVTYLI